MKWMHAGTLAPSLRTIVVVGVAFLPRDATCQLIESWFREYDEDGLDPERRNERAEDIAVDSWGNVFVTGYSSNAPGGANTADSDFATLKYDAQGLRLWERRYDGGSRHPIGDRPGDDNVKALCVDASGNAIVVGDSWEDDRWIIATVKYDEYGELSWAARLRGPEAPRWSYAADVVTDADGNVLVAGWHGDRIGNKREEPSFAVTVKYSSMGEQLWLARYEGTQGRARATELAVDDAGNVYVTGMSAGKGRDWDYATVVYSSDGTLLWDASYSGTAAGDDVSVGIALGPGGTIAVTGTSESAPHPGHTRNLDYITVLYGLTGEELWVARYDGVPTRGWRNPDPSVNFSSDIASDVVIDAEGNVYVTGASWTSELGPRFTRIPSDSGVSENWATLRYGPDGSQQWLAIFDNDSTCCQEVPRGLALDKLANVYVVGWVRTAYHSMALVEYSQAGEERWVVRYPPDASGSSARGQAVAVGINSAVHVAGGWTEDNLTGDSGADFGIWTYSQHLFIRGDCNGDGTVGGSVADAVFLLSFNFAGGPSPRCRVACDADGDGQVFGRVTDAIYLLQYSFLGGPPPGVPFPECGPVQSFADDLLGCEQATDSCL